MRGTQPGRGSSPGCHGQHRLRLAHNVLKHNGDVGVGLNGSSWSQATGNVAEDNTGGGSLVADDVGPNRHNVVAWNLASHNPGGCGVILAGHTTAGVTGNLIFGNGLAGVTIHAHFPTQDLNGNRITGNRITVTTSGASSREWATWCTPPCTATSSTMFSGR